MMIRRLELMGFRGFLKEVFELQPLTIFEGEMGSGKTSRLLAILYALTGSAPPGLTLDDLIHVGADTMWVRVEGIGDDGEPFSIERRKRRGGAGTVRSSLELKISERIFIEGREIAKLFIGAPAEKTFRLDALLGLVELNQLAGEITMAPIDRRLKELERAKREREELERASSRMKGVEEELEDARTRLREVEEELRGYEQRLPWAQRLLEEASRKERAKAEVSTKRSLMERYRQELGSLALMPAAMKEELRELEARYDAMKKRVASLEASMQLLDLEGKSVDEIKLCPLCGAFIAPEALKRLEHIQEEYKLTMAKLEELESILMERRRRQEEAQRQEERARFLKAEVARLEREVEELERGLGLDEGGVAEAKRIQGEYERLAQERRELNIRIRGLEGQLATYRAFSGKALEGPQLLDRKMEALQRLKARLGRVREALLQSLNEVRIAQLQRLQARFQEAFRRIYPYPRFEEVLFETTTIRGREVLIVKAKRDGSWISAHQMSTGENVAISLALLFSINELERSPILLFDEPEEGLDDSGLEGLADILLRLKERTQVVVATRSGRLAQLLRAG